MVAEGNPYKPSYLVIITGPTAVGKTSVAIDVARHFNTEIISADSRQFYKGLVIGTAAPSSNQLQAVKHHFVGHINPEEYFNVSRYEECVLTTLDELFKKHQVVVMTGGSGLYIQAVTDGIDDLPDADPQVREQLKHIYETGGLPELRSMLLKYDPGYAAKVDLANPARIMRALEVTMQTGKPYSSHLRNDKAIREFNIIRIALNVHRAELHSRINHRVDQMIEDGLLEEARSFYSLRHLNSLNTVGYKEIFDYFDGKVTLEEAVEKIKTNSRRYARRQITWFNRDKKYHWLSPDSKSAIDYINNEI
jgi:tRNA dimethylallyltransferase